MKPELKEFSDLMDEYLKARLRLKVAPTKEKIRKPIETQYEIATENLYNFLKNNSNSVR